MVLVGLHPYYQASSSDCSEGWRFAAPGEIISGENTVPDPINDAQIIRDLYLLADPNYSGRFSVPVLWDKKTKTIVSNESSEIIRMFASEFDELLEEKYRNFKLVPEDFSDSIDELNKWTYVWCHSK